MGIYLNPGDDLFRQAIASEIYVDKTKLLAYTNKVFRTNDKYLCVSRPRRFGKSMAANMVAAYYDRTVEGKAVFRGLAIAQDEKNFDRHANRYDVIQINMQEFLSRTKNMDSLLQLLQRRILYDLLQEYPNDAYFDPSDLIDTMSDIYARTKRPFVIIIDEWDGIFREYRDRKDEQETYLDFLRAWLKDKSYVGLAYMTGILPIKKYGTHSALNMFREFSMTNAGELAPFVGFTEQEVKELCEAYHMDFAECRAWYDGYHFPETGSVYSPRSVVASMTSRIFDTYWNQTETFEALKIYIDLNIENLRDAIIALMAGERRAIDTRTFVNDMTTFRSADDVMTLLIHLGYLGYDRTTKEVFIPNREIRMEYASAIQNGGWGEIARAVKQADYLLRATLAKDAEAVAKGIEAAHIETSHLTYNDENALAYTLSLAYYTARQWYAVIRECPTGKGFADLVFLPRPQYAASHPALVVELKWNKDAHTALRQIEEQEYGQALTKYTGSILAVGISYDKKTRRHTCAIREYHKGISKN